MDDLVLTLKAYAKINWTLEVLGRRPDGYHEVATVMETIGLWDTLSLSHHEELCLECSWPELQGLDNLALVAARRLRELSGYGGGAQIRLEKAIPVAAGLGGGSSDAAAVLRGLNHLWGLGLSRERLDQIGSELGSDVPFFVYGGAALVEGRGERVTPLPSPPRAWLVLLRPPLAVEHKTATLYRSLTAAHFTSGAATRRLADHVAQGRSILPDHLFNAFEGVAYSVFGSLEEYRRRFLAAGAKEVHLASSGPTLFCLVEDEAQGERLADSLRSQGLEAYVAATVPRKALNV